MSTSKYSGKLRVRACGLLVDDNKLLLIELKSPITNKWTWLPPGGAVRFGESIEMALRREFKEETGIEISVENRVFINEVIEPPIHAIEFYHLVEKKSGELRLGNDPELSEDEQIIRDVKFFSKEEIKKMNVAPEFIRAKFWTS